MRWEFNSLYSDKDLKYTGLSRIQRAWMEPGKRVECVLVALSKEYSPVRIALVRCQ